MSQTIYTAHYVHKGDPRRRLFVSGTTMRQLERKTHEQRYTLTKIEKVTATLKGLSRESVPFSK